MGKNEILDWNQYVDAAIDVINEGCILLENKDNTLPVKAGTTVSVFGRIQLNYYKSGTGSGGMVNVSKVYNILDGLRERTDIKINEELLKIYEEWVDANPFNEGEGWGTEPWSQIEMEIDEETVNNAAKVSDVAIVIIGRTAGEDKDFTDSKEAFRLSDIEEDMMTKVRKAFKKVIVLLNIGSLINMDFIDTYSPDAVMIVWQGGMVGGLGTVDVISGKVCPSGRLADTVAYNIEDYPSYKDFGDPVRNFYSEDIYVGYRYFETFAKDKVRYPFGYGLSYTEFSYDSSVDAIDIENKKLTLSVKVTNTGSVDGKAVAFGFIEAPQGKLGKPSKVLIGFGKTKTLKPSESEELKIDATFDTFASFDDAGVTAYPDSFLLEGGEYGIYAGSNVRDAVKCGSFLLETDLLIEKLSDAFSPVLPFKRLKPEMADGQAKEIYEDTPITLIDEKQVRLDNLPKEIQQNFDTDYKLDDVYSGKVSLEDFVAQLTDEDLACIVRGEGMGSSLVTAGTAAAYGGVSARLREKGIPAVCCDDGPSGMRLDSGLKAFSLPCATMIASTFNPDIVTNLYGYLGLEMTYNKVDNLLGPGMNIHRHPLNGRNFEYFTEDPFLNGVMGTAMLAGLKKYGMSGTVKHFCGNNQEYMRNEVDSVISRRALREIYLKGFEMAVKSGYCDSIMSTYGQVNGVWTAGIYDLLTRILRDEWGFTGILMTDWWAQVNERDVAPTRNNTAAMVRAQNDLYMVVSDAENDSAKDNTLASLADGSLKRSELQRCALNICRFAVDSLAMRRRMEDDIKVKIINNDDDEDDFDPDNIEYISFEDDIVIPLDTKKSKAGTNYYIPLDIQQLGEYDVIVTGSSELGELAQLPCTLFYTGVPFLTFTFHGTGGKDDSIERSMVFHNRMNVFRLNVAKNGLDLKSIEFKRKEESTIKHWRLE